MITHYKLLKSLPDLKAGTIFTYYAYNDEWINIPDSSYGYDKEIIENKEWFEPSLFTTEDSEPVFAGDNYYVVYKDGNLLNWTANTYTQTENRKLFKSKQKAEEYLASLQPKEPELPKSWEDLEVAEGYFIYQGINNFYPTIKYTIRTNNGLKNTVFTTEKQAKSVLAFAQLSQLVKVLNEGEELNWTNDNQYKFIINRVGDDLVTQNYITYFHHLPLKSRELAEFSLLHHKDLWEQYYELS